MSVEEHRDGAPKSVRFSILTVSDRCSKGAAKDLSGAYLRDTLSEDNTVVEHRVVSDEMPIISQAVGEMMSRCECLVTTGGTGISRRDVTIGAVRPLLEREMPGFGELFRRLSYDEVGTASIMSGAIAGVVGGGIIFCLPGSLGAVKLGTDIILGEAHHMIKHLRD